MLECNEERAPGQLTKVVFDPLLVDLDIFAERLLTILSLGGGLLCGSLDLDNPTSPHEPPLLQNVRKKRYVIS